VGNRRQHGPFPGRILRRKVPAFDLLWNALHTFVRVPVAALLAYGATSQLSPKSSCWRRCLGGAIALAAHGGKTAVRAAVHAFARAPLEHRFESGGRRTGDFSDLVCHPSTHYVAAGIAILLLVIIIVLVRLVVRALRALFRGAEGELVHQGPSS